MHLTEKIINGRIMYMVTHYVISGGLNPLRLNNTFCMHLRGRGKKQENKYPYDKMNNRVDIVPGVKTEGNIQ